jgi:hypothetical protein
MIKASEFRIGNLIHYQIKETRQWEVVAVNATDFPFLQLAEKNDSVEVHYKPILIMPDLIVKSGFIKPIVDGKEIPFYKKSRYTIFELTPGVFEFSVDGSIIFKKLEYLHQLQNLYYFLTGDELVIDESSLQPPH